jgi:two-component system sensor histidine kinase BaeS
MRIKLSYKFFIAFLLTSVISVVLMIAIMQLYLSKNFVGFINKMDMESLNQLGNTLSVEYQKHQGWDKLKNNHRLWHRLLHSVSRGKHFDRRPPPPHPHFGQNGENRGKRKHRPPRHGPFRRPSRFALFDAQKIFVIGNRAPLEQHLLKPIIVEEKTVGWVGMHKKIERLSRPREFEFLRRQANAFYLTGGCILLMTALVAWWLSRHMLIPIQQLIKGTQALTSRQFNTKIKIHSSDELGQLAADFNTMAQTLERYEQMRQQWLSDISHELRTPLSIMRGEIEAIQDGVRDFSNEALDSLHLEVQRLRRIVDDLHELSLAETDTLSFKKVPINPLQILRETLKLFHTRLTQNHIQVQDDLQADENIILQGDADRLSQLFSNLLENTLRYVDSPGTLKIWHKQIETQLFLNLIDSGPGVPEESIGRLFDRLYRVEQSRNRAKGGSGLGLAICKNIVEMHGGEITATHAPDGGLWIKIMFPLL